MVAAWSVIAVVMKIALLANAVIQTAERAVSVRALEMPTVRKMSVVLLGIVSRVSAVINPETVMQEIVVLLVNVSRVQCVNKIQTVARMLAAPMASVGRLSVAETRIVVPVSVVLEQCVLNVIHVRPGTIVDLVTAVCLEMGRWRLV